jgi:heme/copper-type cytochrome/quinol oxidase subunit 3
MDSQTTIALLVAGLALTLVSILGDRGRKRAPLAWYAFVPWHGISFAGVTIFLFAAAHLLTLARSPGGLS